jgi:hypothetical protein
MGRAGVGASIARDCMIGVSSRSNCYGRSPDRGAISQGPQGIAASTTGQQRGARAEEMNSRTASAAERDIPPQSFANMNATC